LKQDPSAVAGSNGLDERQPQSGAVGSAAGASTSVEGLENGGLPVFADSNSMVLDADCKAVLVRLYGANDCRVLRRVLDRNSPTKAVLA